MHVDSVTMDSFWHPDDRSQRADRIARLRAGHADQREFRWRLPDGTFAWVDSIEQPAGLLEDGVSLRVVGSSRDITGVKNAAALERELRDAREQLESRLLAQMQLGVTEPAVRVASVPSPPAERDFGHTDLMRVARELADVAAEHREPVLLTGETGTGKGYLAQRIHARGLAAKAAFVALNCSTMRGDLLLSELFGAARGAFTSATTDRKGLIEESDGGTLFLDEIGEMPIDAQAMLLKVLEEKTFRRLGETRVRRSDFRLICATHRDLGRDAEEGRFRRDLFYRINVFPIQLPSLRDRADELPQLIHELCVSLGAPSVVIPTATMDVLVRQDWTGNIRELRNALIRAILLARGAPLQVLYFPGLDALRRGVSERVYVGPVTAPLRGSKPAAQSADAALRDRLVALLERHAGNRSRVAHDLGISRTTLYRYLERFGIDDTGSGG
jgi:DNA-binding NtrC family response regulator